MKLNFLLKFLAAFMIFGINFSAVNAAENLPAFYDLRLAIPTDSSSDYDLTKARINPIRNQGIFGTCWAFSTIASVESNIYTQMQRAGISYNVKNNPVDLSEWYLAWVSVAAPTEVAEDYVPHSKEPIHSNFYVPFAQKVYQGGVPFRELETMMSHGTGLAWEQGETVKSIVAPKNYLPTIFQLRNIFFLNNNRDVIKKMIMDYGAVSFALNSESMMHDRFDTAFFEPNPKPITHGINIIGWDDNFDFSKTGMKILPKEKGAWIIRNSWGENWGADGYGYLSYEDKTINILTVFDVDADVGSVSYIESHEVNNQLASGEFGNYISAEVPQDSAFAAGYTSDDDYFLTKVGFFVAAENMNYNIEIRLGSRENPALGELVYSQRGKFGEDGTPNLGGYRIVPLEKFVFLPKDADYNVTVELSNSNGDTSYILTPSEVDNLAEVPAFIRLGKSGDWQKVLQVGEKNLPLKFQKGSVTQRCYLKNAAEPFGKEFVVGALNDGQTAVINLGRRGELYGLDILSPNRETLSTMRLDVDEFNDFSGKIIGDGNVIKEGAGQIILRGKNTFTGQTILREGALILAPSSDGESALIFGDVLLDGGTFGGVGEVHGKIFGNGTLQLSSGTLKVGGMVDLSNIKIEVAENNFQPAGKILLRAENGIIGNLKTSARLRISDDRKEIFID